MSVSFSCVYVCFFGLPRDDNVGSEFTSGKSRVSCSVIPIDHRPAPDHLGCSSGGVCYVFVKLSWRCWLTSREAGSSSPSLTSSGRSVTVESRPASRFLLPAPYQDILTDRGSSTVSRGLVGTANGKEHISDQAQLEHSY